MRVKGTPNARKPPLQALKRLYDFCGFDSKGLTMVSEIQPPPNQELTQIRPQHIKYRDNTWAQVSLSGHNGLVKNFSTTSSAGHRKPNAGREKQ